MLVRTYVCTKFYRLLYYSNQVAVWPRDKAVAHTNIHVVIRCSAKLVLRWVTVRGYTVLVCNQPPRPTQPPTLGRMGNAKGQWSSAEKVTVNSGVALTMRRIDSTAYLPMCTVTDDCKISTARRLHSSAGYGILYLFSHISNVVCLSVCHDREPCKNG